MKNNKIELCFESAREFYNSDKTRPISYRISQIEKLEKTIRKYESEIMLALKKDLNKSKSESYMTEIGLVLEEISYFKKNLKRISKPSRVLPSLTQMPGSLKVINEPYGVALIMSPWNYPFQLTMAPLIAAIAAGNCALVKPSAYSPATSSVIELICKEAFEPGLVHVIEGGREENNALLDLNFDYIFFTGSPAVGRHVMESASKNLIPVTLELGGKSPCIVDSTADINKTAKRILFGKLTNSGQTCVAPDYILVEKSVKNQLIEEILKELENSLPNKDYFSENYVNIIQEKHFNRILDLIKDQNLIYPKNASKIMKSENGMFYNKDSKQIFPVIVDQPDWQSRIMNEEIFGPVIPILEWENSSDMIETVRRLEKPLALYVFSNDRIFTERCVSKISSGGVCINDTLLHMASSKVPFGGVGNSGMGNYHGYAGFQTFSHERTVLKKWWSFDISTRYHPFSESGYKLIRKLIK